MSDERIARLRAAYQDALEEAAEELYYHRFHEASYWLERADVLKAKIILVETPPASTRRQRSPQARAIRRLRVISHRAHRAYRQRTIPEMRLRCYQLLALAKEMRRYIGQGDFGGALHTTNSPT